MLVDSHCHLNMQRFRAYFSERVDEATYNALYSTASIIERAMDAGVSRMLTIGVQLSDVMETADIVKHHPQVWRTIGIHPEHALEHLDQYGVNEIASIIKREGQGNSTVAIGEIGLDYHFDNVDKDAQMQILHLQLELAEELGLPVVIHSRDAAADTIQALKAHPGVRGVMHCFSGDRAFAEQAMELGYYISIAGPVTYKNAVVLRDVVESLPMDRLLIETDAPFLAPVPCRGQINESAFITHTAHKIADLKQISYDDFVQITSENFYTLFKTV